MESDTNDIPCPDCGQPRPAGVRCPECGLPSEADAAAARLERVFFRRLRRAIAMCASVLALGTFLLMLWDVPQRDVLISALLFVGFAIMVPLARTLAKDVEISGAPLPPPKDR
ncbi:MAG: hypothetical protein VX050_02835 [Planctomycetota bacterium]|jgi:hypothetical protein|nr:hypothetical protein [Planctomycetota bacterium]